MIMNFLIKNKALNSLILLIIFFSSFITIVSATQASTSSVKKFYELKSIAHNPYKKTVFYLIEECNCPYLQNFIQEINLIKTSDKYNYYYEFKQLPEMGAISYAPDAELAKMKEYGIPVGDVLPESKAKPIVDFYNACGLFCIVDTNYNIIHSEKALGMQKIKSLSRILDQNK